MAHLGPSAACTAFTALSAWAAAHSTARPHIRRRTVLAALAMALAQVSTGSLNDVIDRDADRIHQPYKPIARAQVSTGAALAFAISTGLGSLAVAAACGREARRLMAVGLASGWAYDLGLRVLPASFVPFVVGIATVPMLGPTAVGVRPIRPRLMMAMAGLLGLGLHLANGGPDVIGDRRAGRRSLPVLLGGEGSRRGSHAALTGAALLSVASSRGPSRPAALGGALAGLLLLLLDRTATGSQRRDGQYPFVLPVLAAAAVAGGWLLGAAEPAPGPAS